MTDTLTPLSRPARPHARPTYDHLSCLITMNHTRCTSTTPTPLSPSRAQRGGRPLLVPRHEEGDPEEVAALSAA